MPSDPARTRILRIATARQDRDVNRVARPASAGANRPIARWDRAGWRVARVPLLAGTLLSIICPLLSAPNQPGRSIPAWRPEPTNDVNTMILTLTPAESQAWRLMLATSNGDLAEARAALHAYPGLIRGTGYLTQALRDGQNDIATLLLEAGADPNEIDSSGCSPLHGTANPAAVERLLRSGATVDRRDRQGYTPLHRIVAIACPPNRRRYRLPSEEMLQAAATHLLRYGADILATNWPSELSPTATFPLQHAIVAGSESWAELLSLEGRIAAEDMESLSRMFLLAAQLGQPRTVQALLRHRPSLTLTNADGLTPLQLACLPPAYAEGTAANPPNRLATAAVLLDAGAELDLFSAAALGRISAPAQLVRTPTAALNRRDGQGRTPLHWAALAAQEPSGIALLEAGATPDFADRLGRTPLHLAAERNLTNLVVHLLTAGAAVDARDLRGRTALDLAAEANHPGIVRKLLAHDASADPRPDSGDNPLHAAIANGAFPLAKMLLTEGLDPNAPDNHGRPPLHLAVERRDLALIELLLDHGADVRGRDALGNTLVHLCLPTETDQLHPAPRRAWPVALMDRIGLDRWIALPPPTNPPSISLTAFVLDHGLDPNTTNNLGETVLHRLSTARAKNARGSSPMIRSEPHITTVIQTLLQRGANLEARDAFGWTPLHQAARRQLEWETRQLLRHGADPNARDPQGRTTLHLALEPGTSEPGQVDRGNIRETLLQLLWKGADVNARDQRGIAPIHLLLSQPPYQPALMEALLSFRPDPNLADPKGLPPLHLGILHSDHYFLREGVATLVRAGANIQATDPIGRTPLHCYAVRTNAPYANFPDSSQVLIDHRTVNAPDGAGNTPLHLAAQEMRLDLTRELLAHGADRRRKNHDQQTPLELMRYPSALLLGPGAKTDFYSALVQGDLGSLAAFLDSAPSLVNRPDAWNRTPIHFAAYHRQPAVAEFLISRGATVDPVAAAFLGRPDLLRASLPPGAALPATNGYRLPLLHATVTRGSPECLAILLQHGAAVEEVDDAGHTAWYVAQQSNRQDMLQSLETHGSQPSVFDLLLLPANDALARRLAVDPALAVHTNRNGDSPLQVAARAGNTTAVGRLLELGGSADAPGTNGLTALHQAIRYGQPETALALLQQGADPNRFDHLGLTPLHYAAVLGDLLSARALLQAGANVDAQLHELPVTSPLATRFGDSRRWYRAPAPLHYAVISGQLEIVQLLIQHGARPDLPTSAGHTPVHFAQNAILQPDAAVNHLLNSPQFFPISPQVLSGTSGRKLDPKLARALREALEPSAVPAQATAPPPPAAAAPPPRE